MVGTVTKAESHQQGPVFFVRPGETPAATEKALTAARKVFNAGGTIGLGPTPTEEAAERRTTYLDARLALVSAEA